MAFGFSPKYIQEWQLESSDLEYFLVLALEAAAVLSWNVGTVDETGFTAYTSFSWSSWSEEVTVKIENGIAKVKSECTGSQLMDWGKNKKNVNNLIAEIEVLKDQLSPEDIATKVSSLQNSYAAHTIDLLEETPATSKRKITNFFSIFKPAKGYFITPILINVNILVFIIMIISGVHILIPENQDLLDWGANFRSVTLAGEWWRLFTSYFLHIGILHLLLNMYALFYIGILLEPYLGKARFLTAYFICGIVSSMASLWWNDMTISAGASGAVFGMYGVFIALLTANVLERSVKNTLLTSVGVFVVYNIVYGLRPDSNIDNAAHIGGLISGLIIGYSFVPGLKQYQNKRVKFITIGIVSFLILSASSLYYRKLSGDMEKYKEGMETFASLESMALEVYSLPKGTSRDAILKEFRSRGIYYWDEGKKLIKSFEALDLPSSIRNRNNKIEEYCTLRVKSYQLICRAIEEETDQYNQEIEDYTQKIKVVMEEITGQPAS